MNVLEYWAQFNPPDVRWYTFILVYCILVFVVGVVLNFIVLFYLIKVNRNKSSERVFLINLAVSDLLKTIVVIPIKIVNNLNQKWSFGDLGCEFYGFIGALFGFSNITVMALMTIERYLVIKNPLNALEKRTRFIVALTVASWLYSLVCASSQFLTKNGYVLEGLLTSCSFDYLSRDFASRLVVFFMFVTGFAIPFSAILVFYWRILKEIKHSTKMIVKYSFDSAQSSTQKRSMRSSDYLLIESAINKHHGDKKHVITQARSKVTMVVTPFHSKSLIKREFQVMKTILICVGVFCLTWLPYAVMVLIAQLGTNIEKYLTPMSATLPALFTKSSIILNPLCFTLGNEHFKSYFRKRFKKCFAPNNNNQPVNI